MLRYCAWCGIYQGSTPAAGYQIRKDVCEIDTATICPSCLSRLMETTQEDDPLISIATCGTSS